MAVRAAITRSRRKPQPMPLTIETSCSVLENNNLSAVCSRIVLPGELKKDGTVGVEVKMRRSDCGANPFEECRKRGKQEFSDSLHSGR